MATQMFKIKKIKEAVKDNNVEELKILAKKHGFINNKLRKQVWPILLGIKAKKTPSRNRSKSVGTLSIKINHKTKPKPKSPTKPRTLSLHNRASNKPNYDQIEKDIARSILNFYTLSQQKKEEAQSHLGRILHSMFDESTEMHYIQGFNDVVSVIYAVCGSLELTRSISQRVATTHLSDYIMNGASALNFTSLQLIFKIISYHDSELSLLFESLESAHLLSFCISWLLTWFAHEIKEINVIARIYDYCLSHNTGSQQISLYLSTALLIYFKKQLLSKVRDDVSLHCFFQHLKWEKIDFNKVIVISEELLEQYPPSIISPYTSNSYSDLHCDIDEIKINGNDSEETESEHEYNSDLYTPSLDPSEQDVNFDIDAPPSTPYNYDNGLKPKYKKTLSIKINLLSIPDAITSLIDETVSLFDKKNKTPTVKTPVSGNVLSPKIK